MGHGNSLEIKFIANVNYCINEIKLNGEQISLNLLENNVLNLTNVIADVEVVANFKPQTYNISIQSENGSVIPNVSGSTVEYGQSLLVEFIPNNGYEIESIIVNGVYQTQNIIENKLLINVIGNVNINAIFILKRLTIQIIQPNGGLIQSTGSASQVVYGNASSKYTFTAFEGYYLKNVIVDGEILNTSLEDVLSNGFKFIDVTENHTLSAEFDVIKYDVTTQIVGAGLIELSTNIVEHGRSVNVQIISAANSEILAVYINNQKQTSIKSNFEIDNIVEDIEIKVVFEIRMYIINVIQSEGGVVTPNGIFEVEHGDSVTFEIIPNNGYKLKEIKINGVVVETVSSYILENVTSRNDVSVKFERIEFDLTIISGENGTISPSGVMKVKYGDNKLLKITPEEGYEISKITVNNVDIENSSDIILSNIIQDTIVVAEFKEIYSISTLHNNGGMITDSSKVSGGESKEIIITPNEGFKIKDVIIDGVSVGAVETYSFANVQQAHSIEVVFEQITHVVTVSVQGQANIVSESALDKVGYGESRSIHIQSKNKNWKIDKIFINGNETEILNGIVMLNNIKDDVEIKVEMHEEKEESNTWIIILIVVGASLLIGGSIVLTIVLIKRHKKKKSTTNFDQDDNKNKTETTQETIESKSNTIQKNELENSAKNSVEQAMGLDRQTNIIQSQKLSNVAQQPKVVQQQNQPQNNLQSRVVNPQMNKQTNVQSRPVNPQLRPMNSSTQINPQVRPMNPQARPINPQVRPINPQGRTTPNIQSGQTIIRPGSSPQQPKPMQPRMNPIVSQNVSQTARPTGIKSQAQNPNNGNGSNDGNNSQGKK